MLTIQGSSDLPALASVNSLRIAPGTVGSVKFPALVTARQIEVFSAREVTQLDMPNLTQVSPGKLKFSDNPMLNSVELGAANLAGLEIVFGGVQSLTGFSRGFHLAGTLLIANNTQFSDQAALDFADSISWSLRPDDPIVSGNIANNTGP